MFQNYTIPRYTEMKRIFNSYKETFLCILLYWQKMEPFGFMLSSLNFFDILLCLYYRGIIFAALMALDKIPQVYTSDAAAQPHTIRYQHVFILPSLLPR